MRFRMDETMDWESQCPECECVETSVTYDAYWSCPAWIVCPKCGCKADGLVETVVVYKVV
jgi:hypothetical protein